MGAKRGLFVIILIALSTFVTAQQTLIVFEKPTPTPRAVGVARLGIQITHQFKSINGYIAKVSDKGLETLENDQNVQSIFLDKPVHAYLDTSVKQINADKVWQLNVSGSPVRGAGKTTCLIDTGVDFNHPALGAGYGNKIKGGIRILNGDVQLCDDNNSACLDDQGHGTHIAGILASTDPIFAGVAPDSNIYVVKALDSQGSGLYSEILSGIDHCISVAPQYNITAISMSLGDCSSHATYCNNDPGVPFVNLAYQNGISVVAAAGNCNTQQCPGISCDQGPASPACIQTAIAVGGANDNLDIIYQRGDLMQLMAPASSIKSTKRGGGFEFKSGTSMSTPHVAATIALMQQASSFSPTQIKDTLNATGLRLHDTVTNNVFSFIDAQAAILPSAPACINESCNCYDGLDNDNNNLTDDNDPACPIYQLNQKVLQLEQNQMQQQQDISLLQTWRFTIDLTINSLLSWLSFSQSPDLCTAIDACNPPPQVCVQNNDCGSIQNSLPFCQNNNITINITTPLCLNPGSQNATCTASTQSQTIQDCGSLTCMNATCHSPQQQVIFRTNVENDEYFDCNFLTGCWIAYDMTNNGSLDALGYEGKSRGCDQATIIAQTGFGNNILDINRPGRLSVCVNDEETRFSIFRRARNAELSSAPQEPYASNNQESYS